MNVTIFLEASRRYITTGRASVHVDPNSACNRGYYSIREAARAVPCAVGKTGAAHSKTHSGLQAQFSLNLIKSGDLPVSVSEAFSFASEKRLIADYNGVVLLPVDAEDVRDRAEHFLQVVADFIDQLQ